MQYSLVDLLNPEHILLDVQAADAQEAIRMLADPLVRTGHVTPEFAGDVWKREQTFPTGLPTQPLPVAIPHADPTFVNRSAVCFGTLDSTVRFGQMGTDGSTLLDIRLVFLLAIKEKEKQVEMIKQVMILLQTPSLLEGLAEVKQVPQAYALIKDTLA